MHRRGFSSAPLSLPRCLAVSQRVRRYDTYFPLTLYQPLFKRGVFCRLIDESNKLKLSSRQYTLANLSYFRRVVFVCFIYSL